MIKIAIQSFKNSGHQGRGVGVYGAELLKELNRRDDIEVIEFQSISDLNNIQVDVVHFLVFDLFQKTLPAGINVPTVITIHDVTPLAFPEHYPAGLKGRVNHFLQKWSLKKIHKIITVSKSSKKDIEKYLGINNKKITVVHSGIGNQFKKISAKQSSELIAEFNLPEKYAFYSGNVNWNKNIIGMTQACVESGLDLVIVGKSFEQKYNLDHVEMKSYREFLEKYGNHPKVHILGFVEDQKMVSLLNQASVALFVSFYEGFGFPILEAQACEVPVITAKSSSMPEVGGSGALYVDPYDVEDIKHKIQFILNDQDLVHDLITEGTENVKKFSWEKCAEETVTVYKSLL